MERKTPKLCYGATAVTEIKSVEQSSQVNTAQAVYIVSCSYLEWIESTIITLYLSLRCHFNHHKSPAR